MRQPQVRFCTSADGTRIAYATWGDGPPLLFVQAWSASIAHHTSAWVREWIDRVAAGRTFSIMDRRGTGASQRDVKDLSLGAQLADIEAVMDHARLAKPDIFAVADAATICLVFAARHPERVSKLTLWCPWAASEHLGGSSALFAMADLMQRNVRLGIRTYADLVMPNGTHDELARYREDLRKDTAAELWPLHFQFMAALDVRADLPNVQAPTLVIHRRGAAAVPLEAGKSVAAIVPNARLMEIEGDSAHQGLGDQSYLEEMLTFLDEGRLPKPSDGLGATGPFRTILFTDVVENTALLRRIGDEAWRAVMREHEEIVRAALKEHGGTEISTSGDGFFASFGSSVRALQCAVDMQRALARRNESAEHPVEVRIGLNAGEPIEEGNPDGRRDVLGTAVTMAARIMSQAGAGEILVSDVLRQLVAGKGFMFADRGEFVAKGFEEPVRVCEVRWRD